MRDSRVERNYRNMHDIFEQAIDACVPVTVQQHVLRRCTDPLPFTCGDVI